LNQHIASSGPPARESPQRPAAPAQMARRVVKRGVDIVVSTIALLLLLPLGSAIAVLVVLESPGPVFYRAERVGFRGRPLRMLKFRKMHANAAGSALTTANDSRFTRCGALLARTRLDELPQLWHVLRGEMSLVGPRPESPHFVSCREEEYARILAVRPGLTGWSQLAFAGEQELLERHVAQEYYVTRLLPQKSILDRLYAERVSLRRDVRIVLWTVVAVVLRQPLAVNRQTGAVTLRKRPAETPASARDRRTPPRSSETPRHERAERQKAAA
jgi:lipopolysaccharide/colanic/teichoic acid biosynthesis glycosyltransferase